MRRTGGLLAWVALGGLIAAGCGSAAPVLSIAGAPITVNGTVVSEFGQPVPGITVVIPGHAPVVTDASGRFVVQTVFLPYDALVIAAETNTATLYRGLKRTDPTLLRLLHWPHPLGSLPRGADASGTVSGGAGYPEPALHETLVDHRALLGDGSRTTANPTTGAYVTAPGVGWADAYSSPVVVRAVQYALGTGGLPATFTGFGEHRFSLNDGAVSAMQDVAMAAVPTGTLAGTVSVPASMTLQSTAAGVAFAPLDVLWWTEFTPASAFAVNVPQVPGATFAAQARGNTPTGATTVTHQNLALPAAGLQIDLFPPPATLLPADGADVTPGTLFSFTPVPNAVYRVAFLYPDSSGLDSLAVYVVTAHDVVPFPDLSAYGLPFPPSEPYLWFVTAYGPLASVDAAAGPDALWPSTVPVRFEAMTSPSDFTTPP
jgi:hypothetical protein